MKGRRAAWLLLALPLAACENNDFPTDPLPGGGAPFTLTEASYDWVEEGWQGTQPLGQPGVDLAWTLPSDWDGEVFRVYSRESGRGDYILVATVTSCGADLCHYTDLNLAPGRSYDYYIASLDERSGNELEATNILRVDVPEYETPETPQVERVVGLDGSVWLRWASTGAERYRIFLERLDEDSVFFEIGSTDGTGYLDTRAENGTRYGYRVAAVDTLGHLSARSEIATGVPRPDYHADLLYPLAENADSSGFRFVSSESDSPTLPGTAPTANWRVETIGGVLSIVPLAGVTVTPGSLTTALSCGPGSEDDCVSIDEVTSDLAFGSAPVPLRGAHSYVFRIGSGTTLHYGKVRIDGTYTDTRGQTAVIFDWSYQLIPGEPRLDRR
jgi:hypothetical protein